MPIVRAGATLILFAHVPKCAGTAVEVYLEKRFGPLAFRDTNFLSRPESERWTRTSPQHIDRATLGHLFPEGFFDHSFAVVRHPVSRIVSAWHFQRDTEGALPVDMTFRDWLEALAAPDGNPRFALDHHTLPMTALVPPDAMAFRLEDGLDPIVGWLDTVTGTTGGPRRIAPTNRGQHHRDKTKAPHRPNAEELDLIQRIYAEDFERFGYDRDKVSAAPRGSIGKVAQTRFGGGLFQALHGKRRDRAGNGEPRA